MGKRGRETKETAATGERQTDRQTDRDRQRQIGRGEGGRERSNDKV